MKTPKIRAARCRGAPRANRSCTNPRRQLQQRCLKSALQEEAARLAEQQAVIRSFEQRMDYSFAHYGEQGFRMHANIIRLVRMKRLTKALAQEDDDDVDTLSSMDLDGGESSEVSVDWDELD